LDRKLGMGLGLGLVAGFLVGGYVGYAVGATRGTQGAPAAPVAVAAPMGMAPDPGGAMPSPGVDPVEIQKRIFAAQQAVAADPTNVGAWVTLGNDYFDTQQAEKGIEAYGKALALDPDKPDVLTDQGVLYRQLGAFDKAAANWEKASRLDPTHVKSQFNLGILYAQNLRIPAKAIKAYERVIALAPGSPEAQEARRVIDHLKAH
jgi:cytochrome c-type biogenesis protein CcmH/NrfG